jgi:predicted transcriptional regulator
MFKLMEMKFWSNAMADSQSNPDIETGADTLLSFLEEKTKWPVSKIADDLGVPEETVKKWAKALEKSGLVDIKYSAIKGMVLEYSSDKSYEELNQGRSELALEADEIEIEAEEVEEVEEVPEDGELTETIHEEDENPENKDEEVEEKEESEEDERSTSRGIESHDEIKKRGFDESEKTNEDDRKKLDEVESGEQNEKSGQNISEEEGKEKLKDELEKLENNNKDKEKETKKVKAGKAKIKKTKKKKKAKDKQKDEASESKEKESDKDVGEIHDKVKSLSSGKDVDYSSGDSLKEHLENLKDLGDLLLDIQVSNKEVYSRMEVEMGALKNTLEDTEIDEEMRKEVADTMMKIENDIENERTPPSLLDKLKNFLPGFKGGE